MKPRRTPSCNHVFRLAGGNEDNDLWCAVREIDGEPVVTSTWELTDEERAAITAGANVRLHVWGGQPPVALDTTIERLGK